MSILSQHGYQTESITEDGLNKHCIEGVILSPYERPPDEMKSYARNLRRNHGKATLLFDPHFYISTIANPNERNLAKYDYYRSGLDMTSFSPNSIQEYVKGAVKFQNDIDVDLVVSPTIMVGDFNEYQAMTAIQLGQATVEHVARSRIGKPLLISLAFEENSLKNFEAVKRFLDSITLMDVEGFYITVRLADPSSYPVCDPDSLGNLMYFTHILSINKFKVVFGYTDFITVLLHACGAGASGTGWSTGLRHLPWSKFDGTGGGGGRPLPRYSSSRLLNSMTVVPDLQSIATAGCLNDVLSGSSYDSVLSPDPKPDPWPRTTSCLHHWEVLSNLVGQITQDGEIEKKISAVKKLIKQGLSTYSKLETNGIVWKQPSSDNRNLLCWQTAIDTFSKRLRT